MTFPCPFAEAELDGTIAERFRRVAGWQPQHLAIVANDARLTYDALDTASERVMQAIVQRNLSQTGPIAVLLPQGSHVMVAILGCLKAAHSFVVLSPDFPTPRLRAIWTDATSPLLLTNGQHWQQALVVSSAPEECLDLDQIAAGENALPQPSTRGADDLAAIFYTSGTTGEPKGVMWSHRLVLHTARQNQTLYALGPEDRLAVLTSFGFGAAMTMSFAALLSGATLILGEERWLDLDALMAWLRANVPSVLGLPPVGLLHQIIDRLSTCTLAMATPLPNLRLVLLGGQPLRRQEADRFRKCLGETVDIRYRLAGSETMLIADFSLNSEQGYAGESVPVGNPAPDKEILLLDEEQHFVPTGEPGEIAVRSRYLATGYWHQPQLTASTFLPTVHDDDSRICLTGDMGRFTPDGLLLHLGRKDNMVKIRGYRVQLEAVEATLTDLIDVIEAVAVARDTRSGEKQLIAYLVPSARPYPTANILRDALLSRLPDYMAPSRFVLLEELPRNAVGKVDRAALPPCGRARPKLHAAYVAPRSQLEQRIADIWAELLELDEVGIEDNFFHLGGDSLLALRMVLAVERATGSYVPRAFFRTPTIRQLSSLLQHSPAPCATEAATESSTPERQSSHTPSPLPAPHPASHRPFWRRATRSALLGRLRRSVEDAIFAQAHEQVWRHLAKWCGAAGRLGLYAHELALLNEMQQALGNPRAIDPGQEQAYLMGNLLMQQWWRLPRASQTSRGNDVLQTATQPFWSETWRLIQQGAQNELATQFSFTGWEVLEDAYQHGRGVILVSYHSPGLPFALWAVSRFLGCEQILTNAQVGGLQAGKRGVQEARFIARELVAVTAERTVNAYQQLRRGGIVHFANDHGYTLDGTIRCQVAGRQYQFKASFAEIAQSAGAVIIPTFALCTPQGRIHEVFLSPFSICAADSHPQRFARTMLDQYADFLQRSWRARPESLHWGVIERHLQQPLVGQTG